MAHKAGANGNNMQQTTTALMRLDVPYLKSYVPGFPFNAIDLDIDMTRLHTLFDTDPELREVLHDIKLHLSALLRRHEVILPNGVPFLDTTGRNGADYNDDDWEDDEELDYGDEVDPVLWCIEEGLSCLEELANTFKETLNRAHVQYPHDQYLCKASKELAKRLNSSIQRSLNTEIVSLVFLLKEEILDQECRLKMKKRPHI